jgi:lincosamide nucleotidyltransferase A/C/D/E
MGRPVGTERDPRLAMSAPDLVALLDRLEEAGIDVWLDGGWGVDALLGEETREHDDVDLLLSLDDVPSLIEVVGQSGYELADGAPPTNFVLLDDVGRQVDVHPVAFTAIGDGFYLMKEGGNWTYPAAGFRGAGSVAGRRVRCLTPEVQVLCHAGYELDGTDHADLAALRDRFGVELSNKGN